MRKMKAAVYERYGPPEVVQVRETEKPVPKENEVLIKVHAATVNRTDCGFRSAGYFIVRFFSGLLKPRNRILGCEFAGEIETTGKAVTHFKAGDRVLGYNDSKFGAHAEYMIMAEHDALATIPPGISYEEAAPITEGAHYALCNIRAAKIGSGQEILVNGGTGAIGSAAIQLLKYFEADVTAVCDTNGTGLHVAESFPGYCNAIAGWQKSIVSHSCNQ
ncbi:NAD(P)-dependent alcohol dehydrogenase [Agriterribacter sp.]|uniref:NAD(P)-dependent alcohol dehydrogenase n=1 Tax=Agriterribacter sp. TaxID=2821509 RepID=UPI002D13DFE7|nr:NAD(P)-dependent alcohol dehydrogenase [Agriterribacter sp.]HRP56556.1 NAD(P)-dependent alcohol dehydrogenase [Agriterribacter sp.]